MYKLLHKIYKVVVYKYRLGDLIFAKTSLARKANYLKMIYSANKGLGKSLGSPILLTIEPTNICHQKCPICETGAGALNREKRFMALSEFKYIIDQFDDNLKQMFFYFMGESFLNKHAYDMIKYASNKGIWVTSCTTGDYVDPERLVSSGIGEIDFQIGGMTQEVHEIYRKGGDLKKVFHNMEETIRIRDITPRNNKKMTVIAGFILMKHNEHQVDDFIRYCKDIGVDEYNIIGTCLREHSQGKTYMPSDRSYWRYDEKEYNSGNLVPKIRPDNYCGWIYSTATILVNGDVVSCCRDPKGEMVLGNVFNQDFSNIWNNEKYQNLRRSVSNRSNDMRLCMLCSGESIPPLNLN